MEHYPTTKYIAVGDRNWKCITSHDSWVAMKCGWKNISCFRQTEISSGCWWS